MNGENGDPRHNSEKTTMDMRNTLLALEKNTHKFIRTHNKLSNKAEELKYKNYLEECGSYRSQQSEAHYNGGSARRELQQTLSHLQKVTHSFVRQHDALANRAEYLQFKDHVVNREKNSKHE